MVTLDTGPEDADDEEDDGALGDNQRYVALFGGLRSIVVIGSGFEPYAERAMLPAVGVGASTTLVTDGAFALALGGGWEFGGSNSSVRGAETFIALHRFTAMPEARYHLSRRLAVFGRAGIGVGYLRAGVEDQAAAVDRTDDALLVTADAGAGVALQLSSTRRANQSKLRFWLAADGGYVWNSTADLEFRSDRAPQRSAAMSFGELSLHGPYARLSGALTF